MSSNSEITDKSEALQDFSKPSTSGSSEKDKSEPNFNWLSMPTELIKTSPLGTSVGFGLIQVILEKLVELKFVCPCHSDYNFIYTSIFFMVPAIIVIVLMFAIRFLNKHPTKPSTELSKLQGKSIWEALIVIIVPSATWEVIVYIDGRYYACAMTDWSGKYELIENAGPQKWCKPSNSSLEQKLLAQTQLLYSESQFIGFWTALMLALFYLCCLIGSWRSSSQNKDTPKNPPKQDTEVFQRNRTKNV